MNHLISSYLDAQITPVSKPRMTRADTYLKRAPVMRYRAFKDNLSRIAAEQKFVLGERFVAVFEFPMAASWSKKKKEAHVGKAHRNLNDLDNACKAIMDCLLPDQDSHVHCFFAAKFWAETGKGRIRIYNIHATKDMRVESLIHSIESDDSSAKQDWF